MKRQYERRREARCHDCGHLRPVRWITFWLNGYRMRVCATCERAYVKRNPETSVARPVKA